MSKKKIQVNTPPRIKWMRPVKDSDDRFSTDDTLLASPSLFAKSSLPKKKSPPTTINFNFISICPSIAPDDMADVGPTQVIDASCEEVVHHEL